MLLTITSISAFPLVYLEVLDFGCYCGGKAVAWTTVTESGEFTVLIQS